MCGHGNNTSRVRGEITHANQSVARVESEIADPTNGKVGMEVGVLVIRGKIVTLIPSTANRTIAAELRPGDR